MSVQELEKNITHLSRDELSAFATWFEEYLADVWDRQIDEDARAGRLDAAANRADKDFEALTQNTTPSSLELGITHVPGSQTVN